MQLSRARCVASKRPRCSTLLTSKPQCLLTTQTSHHSLWRHLLRSRLNLHLDTFSGRTTRSFATRLPLSSYTTDECTSMNAATSKVPLSARQKRLYESRREREFYRYYQPIRELTTDGLPFTDLSDESAVPAHRPSSSPDKALTAFCQLGALRLQTRRAMLFFFDSNFAYTLAEATRTLSLRDESIHSPDDELWLGQTNFARGHSVCEATVMLPLNEGSNRNDPSANMIHIVNDLSTDRRFCDRPFVKGGIKARFYAGVPITTPRGINIGAFCVLDDKPRNGLTENEIGFLCDTAATVMTHLELVRATAEHKIGTQMIAGLGAFIDGGSGLRDRVDQDDDVDLDEDPYLMQSSGTGQVTTDASATAQAFVHGDGLLKQDERASTANSSSTRQKSGEVTTIDLAPTGKQISTIKTNGFLKTSQTKKDLPSDPYASGVQKTFGRAAPLVREAMNIDGIVFFDAAVGTFGGLVETTEGSGNIEQSSDYQNSDAEATTRTESEEKFTHQEPGTVNPPRRCRILASSTTQQRTVQTTTDSANGVVKIDDVTESFLRSLLKRYPRGKIWSYNEEGDTFSEDELSDYTIDRSNCQCFVGIAPHQHVTHSASCANRAKKNRGDDSKEILRILPGVRSVGLVGMWDHTRQRWYAAALFWSSSPLRLFSEESEIKYMTAFTDVILAELHRLEAQTSDRAKSDFISTISHELRSPLHGILGSVECLQETETDSFSGELISQIDVCGRTLLDIIDHLLDYSKINHQAKSKIGPVFDAKGRKLSSNAAARTRMGGMMAIDTDVALDRITEEVVETAVYSFCCSRDAEVIMRRNVAVILDIDRSPDIDWRCHVALGAWKRVCINLVSNALKYTSDGYIKISLKASPILDKWKRFNVTLIVSDTGRGMSKDFLESHLFRAFAQEDSLIEGTGLGMNLVAKIIRSFDGRIEVHSERGVGSSFSVTVPLEHSRGRPGLTPRRSTSSIDKSVGGISIGVIDSSSTLLATAGHVLEDTSRSLLLSSLHNTITRVGADLLQCTWSGDDKADIYLVTESELFEELKRRHSVERTEVLPPHNALSYKPVIVLCDTILSARRLRSRGLNGIISGYVELIAQPTGPERLAKAILACIRNKRLVNEIRATGKAIKDTQAILASPQEHIGSENLPTRSRNNTALDTPRDKDLKENGSDLSKFDSVGERSPTTDYNFPRMTTPPPLSTSNPRTDVGSIIKANQLLSSPPEQKGTTGVPLLLVEDNKFHRKVVAGERASIRINRTSQECTIRIAEPSGLSVSTSASKSDLPAERKPSVPSASTAPCPVRIGKPSLTNTATVNLQLLVTYAKKYNHPKTTAANGLEAVEAYKQSCSPDPQASERTIRAERAKITPHDDGTKPPKDAIATTPSSLKPQVILMDINMPLLNGFEATRQIRAFEKQRGVEAATIIALTGLGSASARQEAFSSGVDLFLTKPVRLKELTKILEGVQRGEKPAA